MFAHARASALRLSVFAAAFIATASLKAQGGQPPVDSTKKDSSVTRTPRDSVKPPLPLADAPAYLGVGRPTEWARDEIFQTGATNLAELIERIPGASIMRSGFMLAPQTVNWFGEPGRVRVFLDGIELDGLDRREGTVRDLGAISIWELEHVTAEPTPSELRVYLRSTRVTRTTPETRVDVLTGDEETNIYRGYYGRRFQSGLGLQFGFQQFTTQQRRVGGDGDGLSLFGRLGFARNNWSLDATTQRDGRSRNATLREDVPGGIPALAAKSLQSYLRFAYRSPDGTAPWLQLIASSGTFKEKTPLQSLSSTFGVMPADSADTTATRTQYIISGGASAAGFRATATARYRRVDRENVLSPSARLSWSAGLLSARAELERNAEDSLMRADATVRVQLMQRVALSASASRRSALTGRVVPAEQFVRAEAELHLGGITLTGGGIRRDSVVAAPPVVFARGLDTARIPPAIGGIASASGRIYKAIFFDAQSVLWKEAGYYHAQAEVRGRLGIDTEWRSRFPKGDFTIRAWGLVEHRGASILPFPEAPQLLPAATVFTSMLEIRIKSATITWQYRNFLGLPYETVPGFSMPARINLYGVRWYFNN